MVYRSNRHWNFTETVSGVIEAIPPDNANGSVEATQEINNEYDRLFVILSRENSSDRETSTSDDEAENKAENDVFKEILNQIIGYDIEIEIIGKWIWCFQCYAVKNKLKELGFKWAAQHMH